MMDIPFQYIMSVNLYGIMGNRMQKLLELYSRSHQYNIRQHLSPANFLRNVDFAILITGGGIALVAILISLFLARSLTKPLKSLTTAVEHMQGGDYTQRVDPPNSQDEIGHLSYAFNAMASTIETDVTELKRQDELRRDLIANIAHDLATPLTSVQGFSEAWLMML